MSKKEMIKTNLRGLKLVYSSLSIPKIFVILFIVFDVMYNYWGLFFASHLIDDLVLRVERERILGDFLVTYGWHKNLSPLFLFPPQ